MIAIKNGGRFIGKLGIVDQRKHDAGLEKFYEMYTQGLLDMNAYLTFTLQPLTQYSKTQLQTWHNQFMQEVVAPSVRQSAKTLIQQHKDSGDLCCIVTATNSFVTRPIAEFLGIDHLLAIELDSDNDHPDTPFNGKWIGIITYREGKVVRVNEWLKSMNKSLGDFDKTYFYSDSANDIPLMEKVTNPIATNPDQKLRKVALERGWPVIELAT